MKNQELNKLGLVDCDDCHGIGRITGWIGIGEDSETVKIECPECSGTGFVPKR